jgi:hypothetical protein
MINLATGWFKIAKIPARTADVVMNIFEQEWLMRYPYPIKVVMERGVQNSWQKLKRRCVTLHRSVPKSNGTVYKMWNIQNIHLYRE